MGGGLALGPLALENMHLFVCVREICTCMYMYVLCIYCRCKIRKSKWRQGWGGARVEQVGRQQMRQMLSHTGKHRHSAPGRFPPLLTSGPSLGQPAWSPWAMSLYKPCGKKGWRCAAFLNGVVH